jgi:hypothetical protein
LTLADLRRRTLTRAAGTYARWVERSIGWGTLIWMLFWLVFYAIAASQVVIFNVKPGSSPLLATVLSLLVAVGVAYTTLTRRTPNVILNRADLYRLGLAPLEPRATLAWEFTYSRMVAFTVGVIVGLVWWLFAYAFFRLQPVFAPLALGVWFAATLDWGWLRYVGARLLWVLPALLALGVIGDLTVGIGGSSALFNSNPLGLIVPVVALIAGMVLSRATLSGAYPPLFATHSLVISQLRAMNLTAVMVQRPPDPDVRRRLVQTLRQGVAQLRPTRFLPYPTGAGALGALAWRAALTLYRRTPLEQVGVALQLALLVAASGALIEGIVGKLLLMLALAVAVPRLLGPALSVAPVDAMTRTLGRGLPGAAIIVIVGALVAIYGAATASVPLQLVLVGVLHALIALVSLEKLSVRFKTPPSSRDVALLSAFVAVLPEVTLGILGMTGSLVPVQLGLLVLLLWQPFL